MQKTISGCEIQATGIRREEHPTCFKTIYLTVSLISPDVTDKDFYQVLKLSEEKYCPVWALLKGNVEIGVKCDIVKPKST
jgi:putative redox protein